MKIINVLAGIRLSTFIRLLLKNGFSLYPKYILRILILIPNALLSSVFYVAESIRHRKKIRETIIEKPPVIIIGHWRTGTTYLHQLINLDHLLTTPTTLQVSLPDHFITSSRYYAPIMKRLMPRTRPMDNVNMSPDEPMEDEFALVRMGSVSPLEEVLFPSKCRKFFSGIEVFVPGGRKLETWKKNLEWFVRKITYMTGKQVVLKNPFHTPRTGILTELFPGVKYIHIYRHPFKVVPSTIHMWNSVSGEYAFKRGWKSPEIEVICRIISEFQNSVLKLKTKAGKGSFAEIRYEDLEKNPAGEIKRVYGELGLKYTDEFDSEIRCFTQKSEGYRKNKFILSLEEKSRINNNLKDYFEYYGYSAV